MSVEPAKTTKKGNGGREGVKPKNRYSFGGVALPVEFFLEPEDVIYRYFKLYTRTLASALAAGTSARCGVLRAELATQAPRGRTEAGAAS